jgi:diaminopimelate decarboxylase
MQSDVLEKPSSQDNAGALTLFDRLQTLPPALVSEAVALAGGAAYLASPSAVRDNTATLLGALRAAYANAWIGYSYKTNYNEALVRAARESGALSEVVSLVEYELARSYDIPARDIIVNGPGKTDAMLARIAAEPGTLIADSVGELQRLATLIEGGLVCRCELGIRVAPRLSFQKHASRFGIDLDDPAQVEALQALRAQGVAPVGVHMHITDDRSVTSYLERLDYLLAGWSGLGWGAPAFVDIGGGFASAMPEAIRAQLSYGVDTLETYGRVLGARMKELFPDESVRFICEPGTGLLTDTVAFVTPVLDVKRIGGQSIAVVDGTYFCLNPLRSASVPAVFVVPAENGGGGEAVPAPVAVYGNSCMDIDLHIPALDRPLAAGDILVFAQKGAYASCMAAPFIQGIPALVSIDEAGGLNVLRARTDAAFLATLNR